MDEQETAKRERFEALSGRTDEAAVRERLLLVGVTPERDGVAGYELAVQETLEAMAIANVPPLQRVAGRLSKSAPWPMSNATSAPAVALSPVDYTCEACHDTGYINTRERVVSGRTVGGGAVSCPRCTLPAVAAERAGIPERYRSARLDTLEVRAGNAVAIESARGWAGESSVVIASRTEPGDALYGTGKTHLACAMLTEQLRRARPARFIAAPDYFERLKRLMDSEDGSPQAYADYVAAEPLLCLDDLGKERLTDWSRAQMFALIDARYRQRLPTIITTNVTYDDIERALGGALADRLNDALWVFVGGPSFRGVGEGA